MTTEEPTQLDRIEERLDRILELLEGRKAQVEITTMADHEPQHLQVERVITAEQIRNHPEITEEVRAKILPGYRIPKEAGQVIDNIISQEEAQRRYGDKTWNNPI